MQFKVVKNQGAFWLCPSPRRIWKYLILDRDELSFHLQVTNFDFLWIFNKIVLEFIMRIWCCVKQASVLPFLQSFRRARSIHDNEYSRCSSSTFCKSGYIGSLGTTNGWEACCREGEEANTLDEGTSLTMKGSLIKGFLVLDWLQRIS